MRFHSLASPQFNQEAAKQLRPGMTKVQVLDLVGQPTEVDPATPENNNVETWRYLNTTEPVYRER